jgi:hypothetical protein
MPMPKWSILLSALPLVTGLAAGLATGVAEAAPPAAGEGMPKLRTGERKVVDLKDIKVELVAHSTSATEQILSLVATLSAENGDSNGGPLMRDNPVIVRSSMGGLAFAVQAGDRIWVRRPAKDAAKALEGEIYIPAAWRAADPTRRGRFKVPAPDKSVSDPAVVKQFGEACAQTFGEMRHHALFYGFAADRMLARYAPVPMPKGGAQARPMRGRRSELDRLMDTTTGMASVQEAIQSDRPLWLQTAREKSTIALASLKAPALAMHPFAEMLKVLKKPVAEEKLANATPADFYYARLNDLAVFFKIVDQLDAWATPAVNVLEGHGEDHALSERTLTQLGLERTQLARTLGTSVVAELALVGSDPYVREGSDLTVIFRVKQKAMFDAGLANALSNHQRVHPGTGDKPVDHQGVAIHVQRSTDGALRQHRATVGDLEIVSNSLGATRRVLDTIAGRSPKLSEQPDWRYMMARDGGRSDGLVFLGDRFIAEVVGPRQKIMQARRELALSELLQPGWAALLYGWLEGRAPASTDELVASGLLGKDELRHASDGTAIAFTPGKAARSSWGSSTVMEPLIDLPPLKMVSQAEKEAYERFADGYQRYWQQYLDPICLRLAVEPDGKSGTKLTADLRVLPLIEGTEYREIGEMVGHARLTTPMIGAGLRAVIGIGADAKLRRELNRLAGSSPLGGSISLDWLGDWLFFGVEDRAEVARSLMVLERSAVPQAPSGDEDRSRKDEFSTALKTPVYLSIGLRNLVGATLFLSAAKKLVGDAAPGVVQWGEGPLYKGMHTVHIAVAPKQMGSNQPGADIWYAISDSALVFTLSESVLHHVLDERAGGKGTQSVEKQDGTAQFVIDWASEKGQPLNTILGWLLEASSLDSGARSRFRAEAFLRGAPGANLREVALAYEGSEPVPPDGGHYTLAPDGVRDPARGSAVVERWPAIPVPGSPIEKLVTAVARFRAEIAFDDEPKLEGKPAMRSLHARVILGLRP